MKKIYFDENKRQLGHYIRKPDPYKIDEGKELYYEKKINFTQKYKKISVKYEECKIILKNRDKEKIKKKTIFRYMDANTSPRNSKNFNK